MAEKGPGKIVRALGNLGMLGSLALGAEACTTEPQTDRTVSTTSYEVKTAALTQVVNVGVAKPIPWLTNKSAGTSNFSVKGGTTRMMVTSEGGVVYKECDATVQLVDCIPSGAPKTLQGINIDKNPDNPPAGPFFGPGSYVDKNGDEKFLIWGDDPWGSPGVFEGYLSTNPAGDLEAKNFAKASPVIVSPVSIFDINGEPHALSESYLRNLISGAITPSPQDPKDATPCGPATYDGVIAIGGQYSKDLSGKQSCTLVVAPTIGELKTNGTPLVSLSQKSSSKLLTNPRLAGDDKVGRVLVFSDGYPGQEQLMVAPISYGDKPVDADATGDTSKTDADAGSTPDDVNPPPDTAVDATKDGTAEDIDAIIFIDANDPDLVEVDAEGNDIVPDGAVDVPPELPPDVQPDTDKPETAEPDTKDAQPDSQDDSADGQTDDTSKPPEVTPDTGPEVTPTACDFAKGKISVKIGDCALENCQDPLVDIKGKCTVEIDLGKANPVVLEIDGTYGVDLLEQFGSLLAGKYKVKDSGNHFNTVMGDFGTGVEGTTYSGELPDDTHYTLSCQEGSVNIYWMPKNGPKQLLANLQGGQSQTFDINNPQPQPEPTPDTSQAEPDNKDAGSTGPETATENGPETVASDAGKPSVTPKAPSDGCSAGNNPSSHWGVVGLALLAAASLIKRRRKVS